VGTSVGSWRGKSKDIGAQRDMTIDKKDGVVNICEMKFSINEYAITKDYATKLRNKVGVYKASANTKSAVHLIMVTTYGLKKNAYSNALVHNEITMNDLLVDIT